MRVVALVCLTVAVVFGQSAGAWLDTPPRQWNRAGGPTPRAPRVDRDEIPKMCYANRPVPKTAEERAVARVGWMLFATQQDGHGVVLVRAAANFDGMCRPDAYQDFVFVGGKFAGTLSPQPMNARSDGSSSTVSFPQAGRITAQFSRYVSQDPLCCPSRVSTAEYSIATRAGQPVVTLQGVMTRATKP